MSSLILIGVDMDRVNAIFRKLENKGTQNEAMKKALNMTAKQARDRLAAEAQKNYVIKKVSFRKEMKIKSATTATLTARIVSSGSPNDIVNFKVSPATVRTGNNRPKIVRGKVLKSGSLKPLQKGGIKAFLVRFSNGHKAVAQRAGRKRLPTKTLLSPSVPIMLGSSKRVIGVVQPHIEQDLKKNLRNFISKAMEG
ncbi:hypothetical protein DWX10_16255 [Clostridium sp. AF18-27]|uniref:phage tail protein n=1 Tax=Enterocloster lavalensis TaxID=460384 RepID=UPI000E4B1D88|nr:phage tail protein [Enterocloster lavalensis]RHR51970.1 hypothetical protein DWX10_16255 [Clostridium sp. AF18-27]